MSVAPAPPTQRPRGRVATALIGSLGFVTLLWVVEVLDAILPGAFEVFGIRPLSLDGAAGILLAPLLHTDWGHLIANSGPALVLCFVGLLSGVGPWVKATAVVWLVAGVGTWLTGGVGTVHVGASSLVFGWIVFLIVRGIFTRSFVQILVGIVVLIAYGSILWGVLPSTPGVSWQGHLFGAVGGVVAAVIAGRAARE